MNIYSPNVYISSFINLILLEINDHIGPDSKTLGQFDIPLLSIDRLSSKKKINKGMSG